MIKLVYVFDFLQLWKVALMVDSMGDIAVPDQKIVRQFNAPDLTFRPASPYEFASVVRLYDEGGYDGRYQASDFMLLAMVGTEVVGVVRLVDEQGCRLLRGLYIAKAWRGRGVGRRLLQATVAYLKASCYCLAHTALLGFFGKEGFAACGDEDAPAFLIERRQRYGWTGKTYHILLRPQS
jgi:GNAT superfamily N-acetyltransferase